MANFIDIHGTIINLDKIIKIDPIVLKGNENENKDEIGCGFRIHFGQFWYWDARFNTRQEANATRNMIIEKAKNG